jgi:hypothetical protein
VKDTQQILSTQTIPKCISRCKAMVSTCRAHFSGNYSSSLSYSSCLPADCVCVQGYPLAVSVCRVTLMAVFVCRVTRWLVWRTDVSVTAVASPEARTMCGAWAKFRTSATSHAMGTATPGVEAHGRLASSGQASQKVSLLNSPTEQLAICYCPSCLKSLSNLETIFWSSIQGK